MNKHRCPVTGCAALVPFGKLMCPSHWFLVPSELGGAVYREYRRAPQSAAHLEACQKAVEFVNGLSKEAA
jgi:hypothetical protein